MKDTGIGIPTKLQNILFKPSSRLGAENSEIEGTGIDLTITKHLIEAMGGQINFESRPDNGSTFYIDLPLARPEQTDVQTFESAPISQIQNNLHGKILYVEDNPSNAALMKPLSEIWMELS